MIRALPPALLALSPGTLPEGRGELLLGRVRDARARGLAGVLLREPAWRDAALLELACALRELLPRGEAWLGVHDRVHVAMAARADAVHLGFRSLAPENVRAVSGDELCIGLSSHAEDSGQSWRAADYLFHGPVFMTPSKAGLLDPIGFEGLERGVLRAEGRPLWALGGLAPEHARRCLELGARGVAVLGGLLAREDAASQATAYLSELANG